MFPLPPVQAPSSSGAGPAGLESAVSQLPMFAQPQAPGLAPGEPTPEEDVYANLDRKALLQRFKDLREDAQELRMVFERQWWRDLLYVLNRQWIFFDTKRNEWRDKRLKKWIPKPVTNKMKEVQNAIRSMFAAVQLGTISRPNGGNPKNIETANTVDGLQPLVHEEHEMDAKMRLADFWAVNTGCAFIYPWWNPDGGEVKAVEHDQCLGCGQTIAPEELPDPANFTCPICGGTASQPKVVSHAPIGKGCTDVISPFEMLLPSDASLFEEVDRLIRVRWRPKRYYEQNFPELAPTLTYEKQSGERSLHMFKALAGQNDMSTAPFSMGGSQRGQSLGLTEYEYWEKPSKEYPKGLYFRVLGDKSEQILEDPEQSSPGPIPVETNKEEPLWPWIQYAYEEFGGRLWPASAITPLIQKQDQINQLDSHTQLAVQRMGNPIWLEPKGSEVERFTGEPGLVVKYTSVGTTPQKPERIPGEPIPASTFQLRDQYLRDIEEMAGTYDVLKGQKPTGVEAFSALQLLVERSQSRFTTAFGLRGEAYKRWFKVAIELERKYGPTQRTLSLLGPNNTWTFQTFENADLQGDVAIVVEDGTNVPKTSLGKRAAMEQAHNMGFVDPSDPDTKHAFLSEQGLFNLMPGLDAKKKAALRQQDAFEQWIKADMPGAQVIPPDPATGQGPSVSGSPLKIQPWDDPMILQNELSKWANSDKMQEILNDPEIGQMVTAILTEYFFTLQSMLMPPVDPVTGQPRGPGPGGPPGAGGGGQPGHTPGAGQAMNALEHQLHETSDRAPRSAERPRSRKGRVVMPDPQKSKAEQVGEGFKAFQGVVKKSKETNPTPKKQEPPEIDTGSVGGFLESAKNRLKYAVFGPDDKK
jgi:hypothetical protein